MANSITDTNRVCNLMDCSATVFVDEFSNFFSSFSVVLLVLGRPERSSSTDTRPALKRECHSKTAVRLRKAPRSISRVSVVDLPSFTQNFMQTHCSVLPSIADKTKHEVERHSCKNNAYSQPVVTWQTDEIGLRKSDLGLASHLLSTRQLQH
jgi:hypothetical protein